MSGPLSRHAKPLANEMETRLSRRSSPLTIPPRAFWTNARRRCSSDSDPFHTAGAFRPRKD